MTKRMLIDATHPEETRVVVVDGQKLEEFDYETASKKQLKGNIYLAKVTRVEPSLQAAFVEYGGNRHGFLAFSEIHPDYYQIPVADRRRIEQEQSAAENDADNGDAGGAEGRPNGADHDPAGADGEAGSDIETVSGDEIEEVAVRRPPVHRYKIQEVIKRRQILLVQVVKEERGTKGAALTTYLSLAGRYCVLMPNTGRGGGISRKIVSAEARKRLKEVVRDLEVPPGMAVIVRTAGQERKKAEIKRDFEYLMRAWSNIRDLTLQSIAPALIYEEGNLIKRSIRDLYNSDIDEILVEGEEGYKAAKDFMRMLIPSRARQVKRYKDVAPLFHRYRVESQLDSMYSPTMQLPSGGYIVLNPTEALVSIDVNSGRSTRERNIEETALKTNLEAAEEVARQLRLRDLAGLVVIDFIDMEENRNHRAVEKRLKEALKADRARIQMGRISSFGLLELSRQRLRPSLHETSMEVCQHCGGSGVVRSTESTALQVVRAIEEEGIRAHTAELLVFVPTQVALYLLNQKRPALNTAEERYGLRVTVATDDSLIPPAFRFERVRERAPGEEVARPVDIETVYAEDEEEEETVDIAEDAVAAVARTDEEAESGRKRRPRRRRKRDSETETPAEAEAHAAAGDGAAEMPASATPADLVAESAEGDGTDGQRKRRRRGRRGGRRRSRTPLPEEQTATEAAPSADGEAEAAPKAVEAAESGEAAPANETVETAETAAEAPAEDASVPVEAVPEKAKPARRSRRRAEPEEGERRPRRSRRTKRETPESEDARELEPAVATAEQPSAPDAPADEVAPEAPVPASPPEEAPSQRADEHEEDVAATRRPPAPQQPSEREFAWHARSGSGSDAENEGPAPGEQQNDDEDSDRPRRRGWWQRLTGN